MSLDRELASHFPDAKLYTFPREEIHQFRNFTHKKIQINDKNLQQQKPISTPPRLKNIYDILI